MRGSRKRFLMAGFAALAAGILYAPATADVVIYEGQAAKVSGIALESWGSGTATDSEEAVYTGIKSIKVRTHGRFQGARLVLGRPADIKAALSDPNVYLKIAVLPPDRQKQSGGRSGGGMLGSGGMMGPGGMMGSSGMIGPGAGGARGGRSGPGGRAGSGGMLGPGSGGARGGRSGPGGMSGSGGTTAPGGMSGSGGMMGPGMGGSGGGGASDTQRSLLVEPQTMSSVRVVLVMSDGKQVDTTLPFEYAQLTREGWRNLAVPLNSLASLKNTSGTISEVRLFGDTVGTFYVGQVRTVQDETPIRADLLLDRTVAVNDTVTFSGRAEAGISQLTYEWTVARPEDKLSDPLPVDGEGRSFSHKFRKSGDHIVYLTVRDVYNVKKPVTVKSKVYVTL